MWNQIWIWIEFLLTQSYLSQRNLLKRFTELFPSGLRLSSGSSLSRSVLLPWDKVGCPSFIMRRRTWHPTPVLLPGKSHGRRGLIGYSPQGHEKSDMTEWLHFHFSLSCIGEGNGNPLQCSCLENPRDGGAWWAAVYGVAESRMRVKGLSSSIHNDDILWDRSTLCLSYVYHVYMSFFPDGLWVSQ